VPPVCVAGRPPPCRIRPRNKPRGPEPTPPGTGSNHSQADAGDLYDEDPRCHTRINESDGKDTKSDGNVTLVMADGATVSIGSGTVMGGPECTAKAGRRSSIPERRTDGPSAEERRMKSDRPPIARRPWGRCIPPRRRNPLRAPPYPFPTTIPTWTGNKHAVPSRSG